MLNMDLSAQYFGYMRSLMIAAGIWRMEIKEFSAMKKQLYGAYSVTAQAICNLLIFSIGLDVPALLKTHPAAAFGNMGMVIFLGTNTTKTIMCQSKAIIKLLEIALKPEFQMAKRVNTEVEAIYKQHTKLNNYFTTVLLVCVLLVGICHSVSGDIECYMHFKQHSNATEKPVLAYYWYPFDTNKHYTLVLIDQNIRPLLTGLCTCIVSAFVNCMTVFVRLQLKLLQYSFRNFDKLQLHNEPDKDPNTLKLLCAKHQEIIKYVDELNQSIRAIIFMEYLVSSITFATQILQIVGGEKPFLTILILTYTVIQLLIFAWSSNEIIIQSTELAKALFESNWYDQDNKIKTMAHIMIMRCQKPLSLMIGSFGVMDLDVGISRLKLAYSYTSVMTSGG
ncbi:odorant receptor 30a-like isoform X2 [Cylas formicarius]|uniref:odorant receptor 30a-like isoform X1 n=1 Tax=Cylas formicarius TaxID=197179 RepID=UPI002958A1FF|nr:odorant receptor 30a-like isoform X1 [Cylas formicarius]XP_060524775.1 odorant receptor 30a-like isoform X2 [Cylas formicarius]